jgi:uncharacterized protein DUF4440
MLNRRELLLLGLGVSPLATSLGAQSSSAAPGDLATVLQRQTQELMDAIAAGEKAPWQRYLAESVVLVDENGKRNTKADLVDGIRPLPPEIWGRIRVVDFEVVRHDRVAITTWVADEDEGYFGQVIHARYKNTDTWLETSGAWQLVATQTQALRDDPPSIELSAVALGAYVGTYALSPAVTYTITREGTTLRGQRTERNVETIKVEMPDVLFVPGQPRLRKIFKRESNGRVTGFVERRETWDISWTKSV